MSCMFMNRMYSQNIDSSTFTPKTMSTLTTYVAKLERFYERSVRKSRYSNDEEKVIFAYFTGKLGPTCSGVETRINFLKDGVNLVKGAHYVIRRYSSNKHGYIDVLMEIKDLDAFYAKRQEYAKKKGKEQQTVWSEAFLSSIKRDDI